MNLNSLGVYCKMDKKFYYLETGKNHVPSTINRITRVLMSRNLISLDNDTPYMDSQYEVHKIKIAKEKDWEIVPIFFNEHVKKTYEENKDSNENSRWK